MQQVGRYLVERELGRGSMGIVYLAHDPRVRRPVAIKTYLLPQGLSDLEQREYQERLLREAQAVGALSHSAIVTLYDADEDPRTRLPFIAMEYVPGRSLKEILQRAVRLDFAAVLRLGQTLAGALDAAHRAGIVHRDIKPANILVRESDGEVKLADFGVARLPASEMTRTGQTIGSPAYMSPEQIRGEPLDGRSDLFSLAVVLYQAICGARPFEGEDLTALAYAVVHETPAPISRRAAGLPAGLDGFFERALAKKREARFADGASFKEELARAGRPAQTAGPTLEGWAPGSRPKSPPPEETRFDAGAGAPPAPGEDAGPAAAVRQAGRLAAARARWEAEPRGRRFAAVAVLLAAALGAGWVWTGSRRATIVLDGRNTFEAASLTLFVDGRPVYSRPLAADRRNAKLFGRKLFEYGAEEFETTLAVLPGRRELAAEVVPEGSSLGYHDTAIVELEAGETRRVRLVSGASTGTRLSVTGG